MVHVRCLCYVEDSWSRVHTSCQRRQGDRHGWQAGLVLFLSTRTTIDPNYRKYYHDVTRACRTGKGEQHGSETSCYTCVRSCTHPPCRTQANNAEADMFNQHRYFGSKQKSSSVLCIIHQILSEALHPTADSTASIIIAYKYMSRPL